MTPSPAATPWASTAPNGDDCGEFPAVITIERMYVAAIARPVAWLETKNAPDLRFRRSGAFFLGVSDGTRTRDSQDHNLVLYQLNYTHHRIRSRPGPLAPAVQILS